MPARTLQDVFDECSIADVDLLKMDIEGSEYNTLLNTPATVLRRIHRLSLEYHPQVLLGEQYGKEQLFRYLIDSGFHAVSEEEHGNGYGIAHFERRAE